MTRSNDLTLSLQERTIISNQEKPDLFVSIHVNSSEKCTIKGIETHWYTCQSLELAKTVHNNFACAINSPDRGLFKSMFYVIHHTLAPSILIEIGFISNDNERYNMLTEERKDKTARSISNGILKYLQSN